MVESDDQRSSLGNKDLQDQGTTEERKQLRGRRGDGADIYSEHDQWRNGVPLVGASSRERPFPRDNPDQNVTSSARMQWAQANGIWTKCSGCPPAGASSSGRSWQAEQSSTIDPDLFPKVGEDPEADFFTHWAQVNGIWTKCPGNPPEGANSSVQDHAEQSSAADPDFFPIADDDLDLFEPEGEGSLSLQEEPSRKRCSNENTDTPHSTSEIVPPPLKRLRKKQHLTPNILHTMTTSQLHMPPH